MDKKDEAGVLLPDGSTLRYQEDEQYPAWMKEENDPENLAIYAALAHAHRRLSSLRAATITFPRGGEPGVGPAGLNRFAIELALLDAALEACGVKRGDPIPLPKVEAKPPRS